MKKLFFNLYFWPVFILATITGILLLPVILLLQCVYYGRTAQSGIRRAIRVYGWFLVRIVPFLQPVTLIDKSNGLPIPAIYTPNHSSSIDPYLFGVLNVENCFVTSWPFKIPVYNFFMRLAGYINSNTGWGAVKSQGLARLKSGCSLIIWPEGHRTRDGQLLRFRNGAFRLAVESGYPILPVCIIGSGNILPPGGRLLNIGRVCIILLPAIYPSKTDDVNKAVSDLKNKTKEAIRTELTRKGDIPHLSSQLSEDRQTNLTNHHV